MPRSNADFRFLKGTAGKWIIIKFSQKENKIYEIPDGTAKEGFATIWYFEKSFEASVADY